MSASGLKPADTHERERRLDQARKLIHVATVFLHGGKHRDAIKALEQAADILRGMK